MKKHGKGSDPFEHLRQAARDLSGDNTLYRLPKAKRKKNAAAVELGKLGGLKGGKARAAKLSARRRKQIAKLAANTRWQKVKSDESRDE